MVEVCGVVVLCGRFCSYCRFVFHGPSPLFFDFSLFPPQKKKLRSISFLFYTSLPCKLSFISILSRWSHFSKSPFQRTISALSLSFKERRSFSAHSMARPSRNRTPSNKATKAKEPNTESPSSPMKKQRGVTAGIARGAETESNAVGFGRNDDNQDVSQNLPHLITL